MTNTSVNISSSETLPNPGESPVIRAAGDRRHTLDSAVEGVIAVVPAVTTETNSHPSGSERSVKPGESLFAGAAAVGDPSTHGIPSREDEARNAIAVYYHNNPQG